MKILLGRILSASWKLLIYMKRVCRSLSKRYLILVIFLMINVTAILKFTFKDQTLKEYYIPNLNSAVRMLEQRLHEEVLNEKGNGCKMPKLDPFDKDAMRFWSKASKIVCEGIDWVECYSDKCWVVQRILDQYDDVVCNYEDIIYIHDHLYYISEPVRLFGEDKYTLNNSDHVRVTCSAKDVGYSLISPKWFGYKAGFRYLPIKPSLPDRSKLNVLIVCFDSTSHNQFKRSMPKSYKVLIEELDAVALNSYNIVGDATVAAMFPVLTGKSELELPDTRITMSSKQIDPDWFIFQLMKKEGYRTAYFEDMPWIGTFQYRHNGFSRQPADHYLRAFFQEESKMHRKLLYGGYKYSMCVGAKPQYKFMLDLTDQFFYQDGKKFCLTFITDISHEDNNLIGAADDDFVEFLRNFKEQDRLKDTLLIVMGDHGSRQNDIRNVYQGRIEERLPLMTIVLPHEFKKIRPKTESALRSNVDVITTPFDIHTTVLDYMDLMQYRNSYKIPGSDFERGLSLLISISKWRTCSDAGVMVHWCACSTWLPLTRGDRMYHLVSTALADFINNLTHKHRSLCANRTLLNIEWVMKQINNEAALRLGVDREIDRYLGNPIGPRLLSTTEYYQAKIILGPGKAHYEGSLRYRVKRNDFIISERDISRTNVYGQEAACVSATYPHLNKYCYCRNTPSTTFGLGYNLTNGNYISYK